MDKQYPVRLVGEQYYDDACASVNIGDRVDVFRETHNPHDKNAVVVKNMAGQTIGYIPRESFVQRVIHDDGRSVYAEIKEKTRENDQWQIVLSVSTRFNPAKVTRYKATEDERRQFQAIRQQAKEARPGRNRRADAATRATAQSDEAAGRVYGITNRPVTPADDDAPPRADVTVNGVPIWVLILAAAAAMLWLASTMGG